MNSKLSMIQKLFSVRTFIYVVGLVVLALGITLNTKTMLGVSPIISVAYNISIISGIPLGIMTFIYYILMVFVQMLLLGKAFQPYQFLQIPTSLVTSLFIQFWDNLLPTAEGMIPRLFILFAAIVITAIGVSMTVGMKIVPNPADGLANVFGMKMHRDLGFGKNIFDLGSIFVSLVIGFIFTGGILGIGIGTVISMILTGRVIALLSGTTNKVYDFVTSVA